MEEVQSKKHSFRLVISANWHFQATSSDNKKFSYGTTGSQRPFKKKLVVEAETSEPAVQDLYGKVGMSKLIH